MSRFVAVLAGLALGVAVLATAMPAGASTLLVASGSGLTRSSGVAMTPDGHLWVLDGLLGLCRLDTVPTNAQLKETTGCRSSRAPAAPGQLAFDPVSSNFYAADSKSGLGAIWRLHWDALSGTIDATDRIFDGSVDNVRVLGLALTPSGDLDFSNQRDKVIRRLPSPDAVLPSAVEQVGFSRSSGAVALAYLGTSLYLAESPGGGLTRLDDPQPGSGTATVVPGQPAGSVPLVLAADDASNRLYVGTTDTVYALLGSGAFDEYESGQSNVTGLGTGPGGTLYIADDPLSGALGQDAIGGGRLFLEPFGPVNKPRVTITTAPRWQGHDRDVHFAFVTRAGAHIDCRLDAEPFAPCPGTYDATGLAEGSHLFQARATDDLDPASAGPVAGYGFAVDLTPPQVTIDNAPDDHFAAGGALTLHFSADEGAVRFTCSLDGGPAAACQSPRTYSGLTAGDHVVRVIGIDVADNISDPAEWRFTAPVPTAAQGTGGSSGEGSGGGDGDGSGDLRSAQLSATANSTVLCSAVASRPITGSQWFDGHRTVAVLRAPAGARYAKLTLRGTLRRVVVRALGYRRVEGGHSLTVHLDLSHAERSRLRSSQLQLAVAYGTCRTQLGVWGTLAAATPLRARRGSGSTHAAAGDQGR